MQRTLSALIADPSSAVRMSLRTILQSFDVGRIDTASTVAEARRRLHDSKYDIVLCEYHFDAEETGQDLLEELREKKALPLSTIFIMVTGESSYPRVVGVAEETPDDYMLKPVQSGALAERIEKAFLRREALMDIYEALHVRDYTLALRTAQQMMALKTPYITDIAKLSANILYRLGRYNESAAMYKRILAARNPAWAKLGLARVALKQGDKATAEAAMVDILSQHLRYLPVYNALVDLYLSDERYAEALDVTEQAVRITPRSLQRLQKAGQLAWSLGDTEKAADYLGRAVKLNGRALDLDFRSLFHLALLQFDAGQTPDASSLVKQMAAKHKEEPIAADGRRGEWYGELAVAMESIARREPLAAIDILRKLSGHWDAPDFNLEFALDFFTVIDRLYADDIAATLAEWLRPIALRFDTGRHAHELLVQRVAGRPRLLELVEAAGEHISAVANQAAQQMVESNFRAASEGLVTEGLMSRNNRLLGAAANAAAKSYEAYREMSFRQQAETCLALMMPPDEVLTRRLRGQLSEPLNDPLRGSGEA